MKPIIQKLALSTAVLLSTAISATAYDMEVNGLYYDVDLNTMTCKLVAGETPYKMATIEIPAEVQYKGRKFRVTSIGNNTFRDCKELTSISGMDNVTSIGYGGFDGCENLSAIDLSGVIELGGRAFRLCKNLSSIKGFEHVTTIGSYCFYGCISLTSITLSKQLKSIGDHSFNACSSLKDLKIENGLNFIPDYAFQHCNSITELTIPSSIYAVGYGAFWSCGNLTKVVFEDHNEPITFSATSESYLIPAFFECPIKELYLGRDCQGSFYNIKTLQKIEFSPFVTRIGERQFSGCENIRELTIPRTITSISSSAFNGCNFQDLIVEDGYNTLAMWAPLCATNIYWGRPVLVPRGFNNYNYVPFNGNNVTVTWGIHASMGYNFRDEFYNCPLDAENFKSLTICNPYSVVNATSLENLVCLTAEPPTLKGISNTQYMELSVEIPRGCSETYKSDPVFGKFWRWFNKTTRINYCNSQSCFLQ
ncbi:MAG: leucine-rich repeat domain-containing protein [Muribaculaceae bacterium]